MSSMMAMICPSPKRSPCRRLFILHVFFILGDKNQIPEYDFSNPKYYLKVMKCTTVIISVKSQAEYVREQDDQKSVQQGK